MIFRRAQPNFHYRGLRLVSEGGKWEVGLSPYLYGCRLRIGLVGRPPSVLDVCLGRDPDAWTPALLAILEILEPLREASTATEIDAAFPWAGTRPEAQDIRKLFTGRARLRPSRSMGSHGGSPSPHD